MLNQNHKFLAFLFKLGSFIEICVLPVFADQNKPIKNFFYQNKMSLFCKYGKNRTGNTFAVVIYKTQFTQA